MRYAVYGIWYVYPTIYDIHTRYDMPKEVRWIQKQRVHDPRITESYIHIFPNPKPIDKHEYLFMVWYLNQGVPIHPTLFSCSSLVDYSPVCSSHSFLLILYSLESLINISPTYTHLSLVLFSVYGFLFGIFFRRGF